MASKSDTIKVCLRVPRDIDEFIRDSCDRIKTIRGKTLKRPIKLNDAYVDFLWRGIDTAEDDDDDDDKETAV